ncbi:MAG: YceH family protein [Lautropia sp.]|nr:YceH family protein [Lautropia sp.]
MNDINRRPDPLSREEARALAVLIEKEKTVPDSYPMSVNALLAGCNQRTNRDPVMNLSESQLLQALDGLRAQGMVIESSGGRVMRYEQNLPRVLHIPSESAALLATLMLRGPQTPAELRNHVERQVKFADTSSVEAYLDELANRSAGALVEQMPRQPGEREQRWRHLLSDRQASDGEGAEAGALSTGDEARTGGFSAAVSDELQHRLNALEATVSQLTKRLGALEQQLGIGAGETDDEDSVGH